MSKFIELIQDEKGNISSKRVMGILCTLSLIIIAFISVLYKEAVINESIMEILGILAFGCLGLSSIDKFSIKKQ